MTEIEVLKTASRVASRSQLFFNQLLREAEAEWALAAGKLFNARCHQKSLAMIHLLEDGYSEWEQRVAVARQIRAQGLATADQYQSVIHRRQLELCL